METDSEVLDDWNSWAQLALSLSDETPSLTTITYTTWRLVSAVSGKKRDLADLEM
jgi:hypothetical protein